MKLKVYINNKLYKTISLEGNSYDPRFIWPEIQADRDSGLLASFNLEQGLSVRYEKVE